MPKFLMAIMCHVAVLCCLLGYAGLTCESAAQGSPSESLSETSRALQSNRLGKLVPYAGYEERLRQSPHWQTLTPEEQAEALDKIVLARNQFLERQQKLQAQYENKIKKRRMLKEIIAGRWKNRGQDQDRGALWSRFKNLPVKKRRNLERQLGLGNILSSQQQEKFQDRIDGLSFTERKHILRQLQ